MAEGKPPVEVTDAGFDREVLKCDGIAVVDFWAPWCGPCHSMAPALEAFAADSAGKAKVFKLNVDDNPKISERYEIRSIPTVVFFRDGDRVYVHVGAMSESSLRGKLEELLAG
jgi:thioredoxin 1